MVSSNIVYHVGTAAAYDLTATPVQVSVITISNNSASAGLCTILDGAVTKFTIYIPANDTVVIHPGGAVMNFGTKLTFNAAATVYVTAVLQ